MKKVCQKCGRKQEEGTSSELKDCPKCGGVLLTEDASSEQAGVSESHIDDNYSTGLESAKIALPIGVFSAVAGLIYLFYTVEHMFEGREKLTLVAMPCAMLVLLSGLLLIVGARMLRVLIDNTKYSQQVLNEMRKKI